jgi:hypothetical protein
VAVRCKSLPTLIAPHSIITSDVIRNYFLSPEHKLGLNVNVEGTHTITINQQALKTSRRNLIRYGAQHEAAGGKVDIQPNMSCCQRTLCRTRELHLVNYDVGKQVGGIHDLLISSSPANHPSHDGHGGGKRSFRTFLALPISFRDFTGNI